MKHGRWISAGTSRPVLTHQGVPDSGTWAPLGDGAPDSQSSTWTPPGSNPAASTHASYLALSASYFSTTDAVEERECPSLAWIWLLDVGLGCELLGTTMSKSLSLWIHHPTPEMAGTAARITNRRVRLIIIKEYLHDGIGVSPADGRGHAPVSRLLVPREWWSGVSPALRLKLALGRKRGRH